MSPGGGGGGTGGGGSRGGSGGTGGTGSTGGTGGGVEPSGAAADVKVLVISGRQGSGKGTQCAFMVERLGYEHVSTGDLLRSAAVSESPLGRRAAAIMQAGELMPDDVMCELVSEKLASMPAGSTVVLDGFPRTPAQAEALEAMIPDRALIGAIVLSVPVDEVSGRMQERGRPDDTAEGIARRLELYEEQTAPLLRWFSERGLAVEGDGVGDTEEVFERLSSALEAIA